MRRGAQPLFFGALVAALAVSGCGSGSDTSAAPDGDQPSSAEQQEQGLRDVDPCQLLTPEEAAEFGFSGEGYDETLVDTEPACGFDGGPFGATFTVSRENTVETYGQGDNWARFDRIEIDGRAAARAVDESASSSGDFCTVMFDAGGGAITIDVSEFRNPENVDPCDFAQQIAEVIAPRMPR
ncbi:DUF3558 domain-containing protein [Saccharopolyspora rectivirgula]|jgi:hypothetical protein|uniref:DUF3558 domain-containing protein n=1 Tax=Saccharopolyspora rectivirgula TaxID=28042 RepID=UPI00041D2B1C|nr:DUF3558 domain-containing protein [Saccharopolyspora rectivirgula]